MRFRPFLPIILGVGALFCLWNFTSLADILPLRPDLPWVTYPHPASAVARPAVHLPGSFRKSFLISARPAQASLQVSSLGPCRVFLNGIRLFASCENQRVKEAFVDLLAAVREGQNLLEIVSDNEKGPPVIAARVQVNDKRYKTDSSWSASWAGASWKPAVPASQPYHGNLFDPEGRREEFVNQIYSSTGLFLLSLFVLVSGGLFVAQTHPVCDRLREAVTEWLSPEKVFWGVAAVWALWGVHNIFLLSWIQGFDCLGHYDYIQHVMSSGSVPTASQGWEMFHPPLYYVMAAKLLGIFGLSPMSLLGVVVLRFWNIFLGILSLWFILQSLKVIFPQENKMIIWALLGVGFLPANFYLFYYISNEGLNIALSSAFIYQALRMRSRRWGGWREAGILGGLLGLALLTKISALLIATAWVLDQVVWTLFQKKQSWKELGLTLTVVLGVSFLMSVPYYGSVVLKYGKVFIGNWDPLTGFHWWQDPGYLSWAHWVRFGRSLFDPLFSGFNGFWDGLYGTFWGDGLLGGAAVIDARPPWTYGHMILGYALAVVPTLLIVIGLVILCRKAIYRQWEQGVFLLLLCVIPLVALVQMVLKIPSYSTAKSFYLLASWGVPMGCALALGFQFLSRSGSLLKLFLSAALAVFMTNTLCSFWIRPLNAQTRLAQGWRAQGRRDKGLALLKEAARKGDGEATTTLASWRVEDMEFPEKIEALLRSGPRASGTAQGHWILAQAKFRTDLAGSFAEALRADAEDPINVEVKNFLGSVWLTKGEWKTAQGWFEEALGVDPYNVKAHRSLSLIYQKLGHPAEASLHAEWAKKIAP